MNQLDDHSLEVFDQSYVGGNAQAHAPSEYFYDLSHKEPEWFEYSPVNSFKMLISSLIQDKTTSPTPRIRRARRTYALRLAQSGEVNLNKNLAWGVACMRLLGLPLDDKTFKVQSYSRFNLS